jgi:hypothetical protein
MADSSRLYELVDKDGTSRLVYAANQSQAYRHCARDHWDIVLPAPMRVAELVAGGVKVEHANKEGDKE